MEVVRELISFAIGGGLRLEVVRELISFAVGGVLRLEVVRELISFAVVGWRRLLLVRCVCWRKVGLGLRWKAFQRIAFGRRRRVLRRDTVVHGRWVAIDHFRRVGHLFLLLVELLVGVSHRVSN